MGDTRQRYIAGCMTGTSLDGLDVALTEVRGSGLDMTAHFVGMVSLPLGELADQLRHFAEGNAAPPLDFMRAARQLGELHADAVTQLCDEHLPKKATLEFVVAHGQTIWHAPGERAGVQESGRAGNQKNRKADNEVGTGQQTQCDAGVSWQLFDPWPIVRRINVPVCYDLRQADLIAGGQGAPITPIADPILFALESGFVVNLGGICNITRWYPNNKDIAGLDLYPCNLLLDGLAQALVPPQRFDVDGAIAASGHPDPEIVSCIRKSILPIRSEQTTLGREQFNASWISGLLKRMPTHEPSTWLASAVQCIVECIDQWIAGAQPTGVVLAGGGARNRYLVNQLRTRNIDADWVKVSDDLGIPCEAREAMGFAVLGALSQDGVPITLPQVTGAKDPGVAGVWAGI